MSWARIITSTAFLKRPVSKVSSSFKNLKRFKEAKLQAELSRCMYSEHGFEALILPEFGQVCHLLMVVSYCIPGSALCQAASAHQSRISSAFTFSRVSPLFTAFKSHISPFKTFSINSSVTRTELLAFWKGKV